MQPEQGHGSHNLVTFHTARSPLDAELIASVLREAGIPTYVEGSQLSDEFAISQRLMGLNSVRIQVPRERLRDAEAAVAEAHEGSGDVDAAAAAFVTEDAPPSAPPVAASPRRGWLLPVGLGIAALTFLVRWLDTRAELRYTQQAGLTFLDPEGGDDLVWRWNDNREVANRSSDRNRNGIAEVVSWYGRAGHLLQTAYDIDENGVGEAVKIFDADGQLAATYYDADQDGVYERTEEERSGGRKLVLFDADQDRRFERIEERDRSGSVTRAWVWNDVRGLEVAK